MFDLKPEIKQALQDMDFVKQLEKLSEDYAADVIPPDERLRDVDVDTVIQLAEKMGYQAAYRKKGKFFHIEVRSLSKPDCQFNVNLDLSYGLVELVWEVRHNGAVRLGSPWTLYSRLLINPDHHIPLPAVLSYEELEEVLRVNFDMFRQFQNLLIAHYEKEDAEDPRQ